MDAKLLQKDLVKILGRQLGFRYIRLKQLFQRMQATFRIGTEQEIPVDGDRPVRRFSPFGFLVDFLAGPYEIRSAGLCSRIQLGRKTLHEYGTFIGIR